MANFKYDIPDSINKLLKEAAARDRRSKQGFIENMINRAADRERVLQQKEKDL